jgi:hypothetical protein
MGLEDCCRKIKKAHKVRSDFNEFREKLKDVSFSKNTTVQKTISNLIKSTVNTTKSNLPSDFKVSDMVKKYDRENKVKNKLNKM